MLIGKSVMTLGGADDSFGSLETKTIPTIEEVFGSQPGIMAKQVVTRLTALLHGNIAPLLLMTNHRMRQLEGIGKSRALFIEEVLEATDLRLRYEEERVHERAATLYGSVENTPVQALLVVSTLSGTYTFGFFAPSPAVALVSRLTPSMTIGELRSYMKSPQQLSGYFDLVGCAIDSHRVDNAYSELFSRLDTWRK